MTTPKRRAPGRNPSGNAFFRPPGNREERTKLLIFGEGQETEQNYFEAMRQTRKIREKFVVTVKGGHGFSQAAVVREVIKFLNGKSFDEIWCVLDTEGPDKREQLEEAYRVAETYGIKICLSNPSIEVWFLAHFQRKAGSYQDSASAESALNRHWQKKFNRDYFKNDKRIYSDLDPLLKTAVENAKWVLEKHHKNGACKDRNSSTEVYQLISRLLPDIEK